MIKRCEVCGQFCKGIHTCSEINPLKGRKTGRIPKTAFKKGHVSWNKD